MLFVLAPLTQLNTTYPSITHLTAYMRQQGVVAHQMDLGIELINHIFNKEHLAALFDLAQREPNLPKFVKIIISNRDFYLRNVDSVINFLAGRNLSLSTRFASLQFWEAMYRLPDEEELEWNYGTSGNIDRAKYLASLFLKNICEVIQYGVDENFQLIKYAEHLASYLPSFDAMEAALSQPLTPISSAMLRLLDDRLQLVKPRFVALSVPFPGNLLAALQCAKFIKANYPEVRVLMGGGYVNTELRSMSDPTIFNYVDYITFDDGELPTLRIVSGGELLRTARLNGGAVEYLNMNRCENPPFASLPAPTYDELPVESYIDFVDSANPMHRLWSDGRWNKMMLAHGCYWAKCAFCDTSLDYIARYEACDISIVVDRMEAMMRETGSSGFHFVDEAAPPSVLRRLAEEIIRRNLVVSYWTNVRFDKTFTPELSFLLARSGCIAVSGGLEVASPRVLKLINKGVTIQSASECMRNLTDNGIMVHAYLMYGFPTETVDELYESLETVRSLFSQGLIHSAFWHRYAMTCHSPSGINPDCVGAKRVGAQNNPFANNEIDFVVKNSPDWSRFSDGLEIATYNFMRQTGFDVPVKKWFNR